MSKRLVWSAATSIHGVKVHRDSDTNEWIASLWVAGKHVEAADYFGATKEDAINTAIAMDRHYAKQHGHMAATEEQ